MKKIRDLSWKSTFFLGILAIFGGFVIYKTDTLWGLIVSVLLITTGIVFVFESRLKFPSRKNETKLLRFK